MIYEIFKSASTDGLSWFDFLWATIGSSVAVYVAFWILGWITSFSYSYVFRGEKTIQNFMWRVVEKANPQKLKPGPLSMLEDGVYETQDLGASRYWKYWEVYKGHVAGQMDLYASDTKVPPKDFKLPKGDLSNSKGILKEFDSYIWTTAFLLPIAFSTLLVLADKYPIAAAGLFAYYATLRMGRKIVDISTKLNNHINNKDIHNNTEESKRAA